MYCCGNCLLATGPNRCLTSIERMYIGLKTDHLNKRWTTQRQPMWCWAASIQMVLQMHGVDISQEKIVHRAFGSDRWGNLPNKPGGLDAMTSSLNYQGTDRTGRKFRVTSMLIPGAPSSATLIRELSNGNPILFSYKSRPNMNHAVVCTAVKVVPGSNPKQIESIVVRDPWPSEKHIRHKGRLEYNAWPLVQKATAHWITRVEFL